MPTPYTPDTTGLDIDDAWTLDEPIDADAGNAATFASPFEELADRVKQLEAKAGILGKARAWTALQTFNAGIALASLSLSGALAAASAAITGALTAGSAAITGAITGASLNVGGGAISGGAISGSSGQLTTHLGISNLLGSGNAPAANTLYRDSMVKAWCVFNVGLSGPPYLTILSDFNIASIQDIGGGTVRLNFRTPLNGGGAWNPVVVTSNNGDLVFWTASNNANYCHVGAYNRTGALTAWSLTGGDTAVVSVVVLGL